MLLAEILPILGAMSAPAFFLIIALASLGSPLLALAYLLLAHIGNSTYQEAFARRLLRMALTCATPTLLVFYGALAAACYRHPWLLDWMRAAPLAPGLFAIITLTFYASLLTIRITKHSRHHRRQGTPLAPTFALAILAMAILWLALALATNLQEQAQAVLRATMENGIGVVPLIITDTTTLSPMLWTSLAAIAALCIACAGAMSQEYMLTLRDREPFGRDAQAQMLRLAARSTLRACLLAVAFLPVLWLHLPALSPLHGDTSAAKVLLGISGAACLLLCILSSILARSKRPWLHTLPIHTNLLCLWIALTALLSVALLCFYAA